MRNLLHLADKPDRFALVFMQLDEPVALLDLERNADSAAIRPGQSSTPPRNARGQIVGRSSSSASTTSAIAQR